MNGTIGVLILNANHLAFVRLVACRRGPELRRHQLCFDLLQLDQPIQHNPQGGGTLVQRRDGDAFGIQRLHQLKRLRCQFAPYPAHAPLFGRQSHRRLLRRLLYGFDRLNLVVSRYRGGFLDCPVCGCVYDWVGALRFRLVLSVCSV
jgi:hypothetical protein